MRANALVLVAATFSFAAAGFATASASTLGFSAHARHAVGATAPAGRTAATPVVKASYTVDLGKQSVKTSH